MVRRKRGQYDMRKPLETLSGKARFGCSFPCMVRHVHWDTGIVPNGNLHGAPIEWWKALTEGTDRFHTPSPSLSMTTRFMNDSEEVEDGSDFEDDVDIENNQEEYHYQDDSDGYFDLESSVDATGIAISNGAAVPRHSDTEVVTAPLFTLLPKKPRQMKIL
ncbi:uncharacterized protein LAJ45_04686 [Morchella importuna]|uniref:uncharacterized protein n=1 Tax=Morchella importuna TaxID=1174673 RepID=UPI001E8D001F|nr:uncharacterized protein LAJ45_04686 [Morchella importuna]KAH8151481.1 hypothetical protein LAJ45_04686 [Morchella importuna]